MVVNGVGEFGLAGAFGRPHHIIAGGEIHNTGTIAQASYQSTTVATPLFINDGLMSVHGRSTLVLTADSVVNTGTIRSDGGDVRHRKSRKLALASKDDKR